MTRLKHYKPRSLHFSQRLLKKLESIEEYPITIVEAPSGFGKTTAIRHFFEEEYFEEKAIYWITFLGENHVESWRAFCNTVSKIDRDCGDAISEYKVPTDGNFRKIGELLKNINCTRDTYIVLDNFGQMPFLDLNAVLTALADNMTSKLHAVIITTQITGRIFRASGENHRLLFFSTSDFTFSRNDIVDYYREVGIKLSEEDAASLYENTEGWVAALYLQMVSFLRYGTFDRGDIDSLITHSLWQRLSHEQQSFFLALSIVPRFTLKQAVFITGFSKEAAESLILDNGFLHYHRDNQYFYFHNIFLNYLRDQFALLERDKQEKIWLLAGQWSERNNERKSTLKFYYQARAYEKILSMEMTSYELADIVDKETGFMILDIMKNTPYSVKSRYPQGMISMALALFFMGNNQELLRVKDEVLDIVSKSDLSEGKKDALLGEMELLLSFLEFNRIEDMSRHHKRALELLKGPAKIINIKSTWTFGSPSVLYMYWRQSGALRQELMEMDQCMPVYYELTQGHGRGAEIVMRAEADFLRGDIDEAEILSHKALFIADGSKQSSIYQCCLFILARIAIFRGDEESLKGAVSILEDRSRYHTEDICRYTIDLIESFISIITDNEDFMCPWIAAGETEDRLVAMTIPFLNIIYGKVMLLKKEYLKLLGAGEYFLQQAEIFPNLLAKVYILIYMAIAKEALGHGGEAEELLAGALKIALPDEVYMPFVENGEGLKYIMDRICIEDHRGMEQIKKLTASFNEARRRLFKGKRLLTEREREIALLAKARLSAKEISEKLYISERTVNNTLARIYKKLDIKSKNELSVKKF